MTISVALINYNNAAYLSQALDSVVSQTRLPDELVISDDGSSDGSLELIEEYCTRFHFMRLVKTPRNLGAAGNRDHAIRQTRSEFVINLDSDDWFEPRVIEKTAATLEATPDHIAISDFNVVDQSGRLLHTIETSQFTSCANQLQALAQRARYMPGNQFAIAKARYLELGGLDPSLKLFEDWEFFLRATIRGCRWMHTGVAGFNYRKTGTGLSAASQGKLMKYRLLVIGKTLLRSPDRLRLLNDFGKLFFRKGLKYASGKASPIGYN